MTDRELLVELLAIKQYEHDHSTAGWPPKPGYTATAWRFCDPEDRQMYRDMIENAENPEALYDADGA
jgi:hypothetical protein